MHGRRLLVAHLLGWITILLGRWAVALLLRRVLSLRRAGCDVLADVQCSFAMRVDISCVARACLLTRRIAAGTEGRCCSSLGWPLCAVCVCDRFWLGGATRLRAFCRCGLVGLAHAAQRWCRLPRCMHYSPVSLDEKGMYARGRR